MPIRVRMSALRPGRVPSTAAWAGPLWILIRPSPGRTTKSLAFPAMAQRPPRSACPQSPLRSREKEIPLRRSSRRDPPRGVTVRRGLSTRRPRQAPPKGRQWAGAIAASVRLVRARGDEPGRRSGGSRWLHFLGGASGGPWPWRETERGRALGRSMISATRLPVQARGFAAPPHDGCALFNSGRQATSRRLAPTYLPRTGPKVSPRVVRRPLRGERCRLVGRGVVGSPGTMVMGTVSCAPSSVLSAQAYPRPHSTGPVAAPKVPAGRP